MSTSRRVRGHAPKDSGISMSAAKPDHEPDLLPTPPSSQEGFFLCDRCTQPRAAHRRLSYRGTSLQLCDYCYQPPGRQEVRDASIVFEMKWCRQGNHEAPAVNFRDAGNMTCYHCADRAASYPSMPLPQPSKPRVVVRPDSDSSRRSKGVEAAPGYDMKQHQQNQYDIAQEYQRRRKEERPQIQYYSSSYKPRGFENSSRLPKTLPTYYPHVRQPNMGNYIIKSDASPIPLQRLDPNTETRAQPQSRPKTSAVHGSRTYHDVPKPVPRKPLPRAQPRSMDDTHNEQPHAIAHNDILKTVPTPPPRPSKAVPAQRSAKPKVQVPARHPPKTQQHKPQPQQKRQPHRSPPQSPHTRHHSAPFLESSSQPRHHQKSSSHQQKLPPPQKSQQKRPRPKTQYDKPPASPSWELKLRRSQELKNKRAFQQPGYELMRHHLQAQASTEEARADSEVLGPQETCPACRKHYPSFSEMIEAYGFCYECLQRHLVAAGELLECPSCRQLQDRDDFVEYNNDGLIVNPRTKECLDCQWENRMAMKLKNAVLCGTGGLA
ncbi:hypothetical protein PGQ11_004368 [Apiospora arundinis]|uniref:RING-type domain-containing protein n=1 Tax=Apiospora arundinis TaxID=335852 RepID=A0ABR2J829_9PEZI